MRATSICIRPTHRYRSRLAVALYGFNHTSLASTGGRWLLATSPRTPRLGGVLG
jgi:hypothetical protein